MFFLVAKMGLATQLQESWIGIQSDTTEQKPGGRYDVTQQRNAIYGCTADSAGGRMGYDGNHTAVGPFQR